MIAWALVGSYIIRFGTFTRSTGFGDLDEGRGVQLAFALPGGGRAKERAHPALARIASRGVPRPHSTSGHTGIYSRRRPNVSVRNPSPV